MKLHLGLKSKVCILLFLFGSSLAFAQDGEVQDPSLNQSLDVEESFQEEGETSFTEEDPLSISDPESQNFEEEIKEEESIAEEIEKASPELEDKDLLAEPEESLLPPPPTEEELFAEESDSSSINSADGMVAVPPTGLVEYQAPEDFLKPYSERRGNHGAYVAVDYEPTVFKNYFFNESSYEDIFGSTPLPMVRLSVDYKLNTGFGAFSLGMFYSLGSVSGRLDEVDYSLEVTRTGASFKLALDRLTEVPYIVPYIGVMGHQTALKSETTDVNENDDYPFAATWIAGALFQLDWLDQAASVDSRKVGIENTFLDVFATQYAAVSDPNLADTETDMIFGAGLRLEF